MIFNPQKHATMKSVPKRANNADQINQFGYLSIINMHTPMLLISLRHSNTNCLKTGHQIRKFAGFRTQPFVTKRPLNETCQMFRLLWKPLLFQGKWSVSLDCCEGDDHFHYNIFHQECCYMPRAWANRRAPLVSSTVFAGTQVLRTKINKMESESHLDRLQLWGPRYLSWFSL